MREGRAAEEILYVVMCVIISFLIVAACFALLIVTEQAIIIRRLIFVLGASLNILVAVRSFTRGRRTRGLIFAAAAALCAIMIFI